MSKTKEECQKAIDYNRQVALFGESAADTALQFYMLGDAEAKTASSKAENDMLNEQVNVLNNNLSELKAENERLKCQVTNDDIGVWIKKYREQLGETNELREMASDDNQTIRHCRHEIESLHTNNKELIAGIEKALLNFEPSGIDAYYIKDDLRELIKKHS